MSTAKPFVGPAATPIPEGDERWNLVVRIVGSPQFAKSHQLRDILLYISQRSLSGPNVTIKEFEIGCEVLDRGPDFNPQEDNIVRVQVGHLRKRLDEYFGSEGKTEPLRLVLPKGSYVPRFEPVAPLPLPKEIAAQNPAEPQTPTRAPIPRARAFAFAALIVILCASCFAAGRFLRSSPAPAKQLPPTTADRLWSTIFSAQSTTLVVSDTCLVMLQDIFGTDIALENYLSGQYPENLLSRAKEPSLRSALELIASRQYTSLADLNTASALVQLGRRYSTTPLQIRYARHLNIREFKTGNFILLGSRRGIPWSRLFDQRLQFSMEEDKVNKSFYFRNNRPRPGEDAEWRSKFEGGNVVESYADLAVVPNLGGTGYTMLLTGLTMQSSEGAGELVTGPEFAPMLSSLIPAGGPPMPPRYFEVLLRTRVIAGAAKNAEVVATRILEPNNSGN